MRIVFMGTPEFAIPSLNALVDAGFEVILVVTQKDKPQDRGREVKAPPVKQRALSLDISVLQPEKLSKEPEHVETIRKMEPDVIVTCAFGQMLPQSVLDIPRQGTINVHGSLLPLLRGAAPIQRAITEGHDKTGITTMMTELGMDTGDMLLTAEIGIDPDMTAGELHDRMSLLGAETLVRTLRMLEAGTLKRIPQEHDKATYAAKITKETGHIDWNQPPETIHRLVRGTTPWPGAWSMLQDQKMRIWWTVRVPEDIIQEDALRQTAPGAILTVSDAGMLVRCNGGCVLITEIQMPSSKRMSVQDYARGHQLHEGMKLS